jgi:endonuclease YncB( thermonuclease family)
LVGLQEGVSTLAAYPGSADQAALAYMHQLTRAEQAAKKKGKGVWQKTKEKEQENFWRKVLLWPLRKFKS